MWFIQMLFWVFPLASQKMNLVRSWDFCCGLTTASKLFPLDKKLWDGWLQITGEH